MQLQLRQKNNTKSQNQIRLTNLLQQLNIKLNLKNPIQDQQQIHRILISVLDYPSTQKALTHFHSNRLGQHDLKSVRQTSQIYINQIKNQYCSCCGLKKQNQVISLCTSFIDIINQGTSTFLFFNSILNAILMLSLLFIIYSVYSLATNILASQQYSCSYYICNTLSISLSSKQLNPNQINKKYYVIQSWIGVGLVICWGFFFLLMSYREKRISILEDETIQSPSDFTVLIENLPRKFCNKQSLQQVLQKYYNQISVYNQQKTIQGQQLDNQNNFFKIQTFNIAQPYYLSEQKFNESEYKQTKKKYDAKLDEIRNLVKKRILRNQDFFDFSMEQRVKMIQQVQNLKNILQKVVKNVQNKQQIKYQHKYHRVQQYNIVFVTFRYSKARHLLTKLNKQYLKDKIRDLLLSIAYKNNRLQIDGIQISRAPQPQDIIWKNIGIPKKRLYFRKFVTFSVTVILLGISFGSIYGLSIVSNSQQNDEVISIILSLIITIINVILSIILEILTKLEMNFTKTNYQRSHALKTVMAQLLNNILITFITNRYIKHNIYQHNGLAHDIFYLGLSNAFTTPILMLINIPYYINKIVRMYYNQPSVKLHLTQDKLNQIFSSIQFQIGNKYVYIVESCIFTSFFVSLQPILPIISILGFILYYWIQKWNLFNRYNRPPPGSDIVKSAMNQLLYTCPMMYALGSLTWPIFLQQGSPKQSLLPNLIALGIAIFSFVIPLQVLCDKLVHKNLINLKYSDCRINFTTEYDRLNPMTLKEGYENYMKFLSQYEKNRANKKIQSQKLTIDLFTGILNEYLKADKSNEIIDINNGEQTLINNIITGQSETGFKLMIKKAKLATSKLMKNFNIKTRNDLQLSSQIIRIKPKEIQQ